MSKTKSSSKAAKPAKADVLSKVKNGGVVKPAKEEKSKKDIAKKAVEKEDKKSKKDKKKVKEPTPEPSSEEEESASSESESSESEAEVETKKPAVNGKASKKSAPKEESSDESDASASSESDSSEDEAPAKKAAAPAKTNGVKVSAKKDDSGDDSASESEDDSDDEAEAKVKANGAAVKADGGLEEESGSDSSDSSSDEEEEEKPATKANKRKAEDAAETAPKKAKTEVAAAGDGEGKKNLFVGNLSWNIDEAWLRETFEEHGELSGCRVMYDKATQRAKGFGYVEYVNAEDAAKAYEAKTGFELDGRTINLDWASAKPDNTAAQNDRRKSYGDQLSDPTDTLFVGNLAWDVGQEQVSEAFAAYGTIISVRLPTSPDDGRPKGFGYVTFTSVDEAKSALDAMQGSYISSRPVRLDYSQPRPDRGDGGGRGRGGFGGGRGGDRGFGGRGRGGDRGRGGRGSFGGGRGRGAPRGGRGGSTNRGGFGDFSGQRVSFD